MSDSKGNKVFLVGGAAYGNPGTSLAGTQTLAVASATVTIKIDKKGIFQGVVYEGKTYRLDDWNKRATADPAGPYRREEQRCNCN